MAVAHETVTESHTGTSGSISQASFDISVPFTSNSKGLLVYTFNTSSTTDTATSVKIDPAGANTDVPAVTGGRAVDTAIEPADCKAWFLGSGLPTTTTTVRINRTNNTDELYAVAITVTALGTTEVHTAGIALLQDDGLVTQQNVDDGSPGTNSLRYAALYWGGSTPIGAGANSTSLGAGASIDLGARIAQTARETTAGQGSRPVGFDSGAGSDDRAAVHLAVREATGGSPQALTGSLFTKAPTFFTGAVTATYNLTGILFTKAPTFFIGTVTATRTLTGVLFTKAPTFPTGVLTATFSLTGSLFVKAPTFFTGTVTSGAVTLNGVLFTKAPTFPQGAITTGPVALTGVLFTKAPTFPTGAVTTTVTLTGVLFTKAPTFPTGTIGQAGTLFGNLYINTPLFFTGTMGQFGGSFWRPNPAGYTLNPVAFVRVGPNDLPPWPIEIHGNTFTKAPSFPVGAVS